MARERAIANQLAKLFGESTLPIYALDDRRRIVFCNPACAEWLGIEVEQLVGRQCSYDSADSGETERDLTSNLCPPPAAFFATQLVRSFQIINGQASDEPRLAECTSLPNSDGECVGVLVVVRECAVGSSACSNSIAASTAEQLHVRLQQLVHQQRMPYRMQHLVGDSLPMQRVRDQVKIAIQTLTSVQIVGPGGSGRERVARTIHSADNPQQAGPLMPLSCSLLDGELLQATVVAFLHRASQADPAHPATLLLLDADQLNAQAQAELLAFFRVPTFALRTIATSTIELTALAEQGDFLRELAFRLSPMTIDLPPLSEHREDLPLLCQSMLEDYNSSGEKQLGGFAPAALERLCSLPWNGDIEELAEVVRESCVNADGPMVFEADLARRVKLVSSAVENPIVDNEEIKLDEFLEEVERELLARALATAKGNKAEVARSLGISRARVIRRVSQLGLE